jgi:TonB family protein
MKAGAVSYGAVELKQMEHRYMAAGLGFSIAIHICVIAAYLLKGVVIYERPPFLPPYPRSPHPWDPTLQIDKGTPRFDLPTVPRGGAHRSGGKFAIPVPVPNVRANEDTSLLKPGDPGINGLPGAGGDLTGEGDGLEAGLTVPDEKPPEPFVVVEREPVLINKVAPGYPELAIKAGLEGKVWVRIWVDREGRAHKAEVMRSTAEVFNEAALAAAMKFVFVPAYTTNGPVSVWVSIPFTFRLKQ